MKLYKKVFLLTFLVTQSLSLLGQNYLAEWQSLDKRPTPEWYPNAKFGIFIHWGVYAVPAWASNSYADGFGSNYAEWYWQRLFAKNLKIHPEFVDFHRKVYGPNFNYQEFAPMFKCELWNPTDWARILKSSGAKYVVLTSKHHDGYCLWPSAQAWNWNAMDVGPKRDLVGELSAAIKSTGIKMGLYYSLYEWFNPTYKSNIKSYVQNQMIPQIKDIVQKYDPELLWVDGDWDHPDTIWQSATVNAWLYNEAPTKNTIVTNDRWGSNIHSKHGSFQTSEYGRGNLTRGKPWEETRGIGQSFGYNRNEQLEQYATSKELIHELIKVVARGGNFLLNIGPRADGSIPVIMQQRLFDIGQWLEVNGSAIYESMPWQEGKENLFFTKKGGKHYVIMSQWQSKIIVETTQKPKNIRFVGSNVKINYTYKNGSLTLSSPSLTPDLLPCHHAWVYELEF